MVSTRSKDTEKVVGLEIGADDYLTKPYNSLELIARIRVALRRGQVPEAGGTKTGGSYKSGPLEINVDERAAKINKKEIKLTKKEFDLLVTFVSKPGKVFSRSGLMEIVWGYTYNSLQRTVDSHIKTLRKKLGSLADQIETVTGVGYKWVEREED
jgi:DNA-binding response OmpR family regulator